MFQKKKNFAIFSKIWKFRENFCQKVSKIATNFAQVTLNYSRKNAFCRKISRIFFRGKFREILSENFAKFVENSSKFYQISVEKSWVSAVVLLFVTNLWRNMTENIFGIFRGSKSEFTAVTREKPSKIWSIFDEIYDENMTKFRQNLWRKFLWIFLTASFQSEFCFSQFFIFWKKHFFGNFGNFGIFFFPKFRKFWQNFSGISQIGHFREILGNFREICIKFVDRILRHNSFSRKIVFFRHVGFIALFLQGLFRQNFPNLTKMLRGISHPFKKFSRIFVDVGIFTNGNILLWESLHNVHTFSFCFIFN